MKRKIFAFSILITTTLLLLAVSCQKDVFEQPPPLQNFPPNTPTSETPANSASNVSINVNLSWTCSDPDGDPLDYDVYFGTNSYPPLIAEYYTSTTYDLGTLNYNTTYYWKIVAFDDEENFTPGPVWKFNTGTEANTPIANFDASPTNGTAPLTVNFNDQSLNNPSSWQWNFGDGGTSTLANPSHVYNSVGTYTVSLTVTNAYGTDTETKNNYIVVGAALCPSTFVDARDSKVYSAVQIGTQCWMAENINIGARIYSGDNQVDNGTIEKYCYDNMESKCNIYGGLYQWDEMMQYVTYQGAKGICPANWHLPTDDEWKILEGTVDSQYGVGDQEWDKTNSRGYDAGENLKSTYGWNSGGNGLNLYGFSALPGGFEVSNGFTDLGLWTNLWTSSQSGPTWSYMRRLSYNSTQIDRHYMGNKLAGFSVRCVKDN